jgi:hypothetical protein
VVHWSQHLALCRLASRLIEFVWLNSQRPSSGSLIVQHCKWIQWKTKKNETKQNHKDWLIYANLGTVES